MSTPIMRGVVESFILVIDPNFEHGKYERLTYTTQSEMLQRQHAVFNTQDPILTCDIYMVIRREDGDIDVQKDAWHREGTPMKKLPCDCGRYEWLSVIPGFVGGLKTTCQKCQAEQAANAEPDFDYGEYYDRLARQEEF